MEIVDQQQKPKRLSIIVKPSHSCNLACAYCYISPEAEQGRMDDKTLENMIHKSMSTHDEVSFIWHGGEPLMLPLEFYERAVELQKRYPSKATNGFQTNGTRVTDEVLDFCEENRFTLGFSMDGPIEINDKTRFYKDGSSCSEKILEVVKKSKARKLGGGIIVVLSKTNISKLDEIYEFAKREGIGLKLNPLIRSGRAIPNFAELGIGPEEYGTALVKLFDKWFYDDSEVHIDPFEDLMGNMLTGKPWGCQNSVSCQYSFISIGPQGDIYPCGRFDGVREFRLGNINEDDLVGVLKSEKRIEMQRRASRITACLPCEYQKICNSGCMHNGYMVRGKIDDKDFYCKSYRILFDHIKEAMKTELSKVEVPKNEARP